MTLGSIVDRSRTLEPAARQSLLASGLADRPVRDVTHDSRAVHPDTVFVAIAGARADGAVFAADAVRRGAVAVAAARDPGLDPGTVWLPTTNPRLSLAELASIVHGDPSQELLLVGVTGTNGKTTTAYLLASVFDAAGLPSGRLGTVSFRVGPSPSDERDASHTTPEASDVQRFLREMVTRGCRACAMEVSSHALAQGRAEFLRFRAAIFTNLTRDHLDFHGDMTAYFAAKRRLFEMLPDDAPAVVNVDDPNGAELAAALPHVVTFGVDRPADVRPGPIAFTLEGLAFDVITPSGSLSIRSPLVGRPNVYNILGVVAAAIALGLDRAAIERGISALDLVPGRFQIVSRASDDVRVVVDYAHTDDALRHLLETARAVTAGRVMVVFGCGGDRDKSKRPLMGAVAARLADRVVLTSDNPRSEDPDRILDDIVRGLAPTVEPGAPLRAVTPFVREPDRRQAIDLAIRSAVPGDLVVIAGKGHEKYQVVGGRTLPFDDVDVARAALAHRRSASKV